jgi:WD40 repeat protein
MKMIAKIGVLTSLLALAAAGPEREARTMPYRLAFAPDGKTLAVVGHAGGKPSLELWDVAARRRLWRVELGAASRGLAWAGGETLLVAAGPAVLVIDPSNGKTRRGLEPHGKSVTGMAVTKDGKTLATVGDDRTLRVRDWKADRVVVKCDGDAGAARCLSFSSDGKRLLAANGKAVILWDATTGKRLRDFAPSRFHVPTALFKGAEVVTGGYDGAIRVWDAEGGKAGMRFAGPGGVDGLALHEGRHLLAAWGYSRSISLYDINPGPPDAATATRIKELLAKLDDDSYETREAASRDFRPLGFVAEKALRRAVESSPSAEVRIRARLLRRALFSEPRHLEGHAGRVRDAVFSADGKTLASCAEDGTVRLWDTASGKEIGRLP